jgi:hypothetical protein
MIHKEVCCFCGTHRSVPKSTDHTVYMLCPGCLLDVQPMPCVMIPGSDPDYGCSTDYSHYWIDIGGEG